MPLNQQGTIALLLSLVLSTLPRPPVMAERPAAWPSPVAGGSEVISGQSQQPRELKPGEPVEVELAAGGSHSYTVHLESGQYLHVVVDQRGIDVVVRAFDPQGMLVSESNNPVGAQGPEILSLIGSVAG